MRLIKQSVHRGIRRRLAALLLDAVIAAGIVGGFYFCNYKLPHKGHALNISAGAVITAAPPSSGGFDAPTTNDGNTQMASGSTATWKKKFQTHFSDTVISTDTVYKSPNISIELTQQSYDSSAIDTTENGKHCAYGTNIYYTLADIYVSSIECLQTAFAQDTYGVGFTEGLSSMSQRMRSVLAVNGDSYSFHVSGA